MFARVRPLLAVKVRIGCHGGVPEYGQSGLLGKQCGVKPTWVQIPPPPPFEARINIGPFLFFDISSFCEGIIMPTGESDESIRVPSWVQVWPIKTTYPSRSNSGSL